MVISNKKSKALILALAAISLILVVSLPLAYATAPEQTDPTSGIKTLKAQGFAVEKIGDQTTKLPASFTLNLQATEKDAKVKKFDVVGGTVTVNGVTYTIASGKGGVIVGKRLILLEAQGTSPDGAAVTLKLAGRYFWMGGHLFVARIGAKLQADSATYTLHMRAKITV